MTTPASDRAFSTRFVAGGLLALFAVWWMGGPKASGQQAAEETRYEYTVVSIESNALQAKLSELGNQGWDLVAITTSEARVDGANNPPKVVTEKYDVTCRKVIRK